MKTLQKKSRSITKSEGNIIRVRMDVKNGKAGIIRFVLEQMKLKEPTLIERFEKTIKKVGLKQLEKDNFIKIVYCDGDLSPATMVVEVDIERMEEKFLNDFWDAEAESHSRTAKDKEKNGVKFVDDW